jgi:predicted adenylyl cyclase CyaB
VRKVRRLYRKGNTRIHLDEVEGLGTFLELEVVLQPGQAETEGHATVSTILDALGLVGAPRIGCAYIDMLLPDAPVKEPAL